ncbi:MAG: HigA family addiction module antitoxin [Geminicoccaceae bacterium]
MTITREQLDSGTIDFSDIDLPGSPRMPPIHPGEILADWLGDAQLTPSDLATGIRLPPERVTAVLQGAISLSAAFALRLARYFGTSPQFWLNLQSAYDLEVAELAEGEAIAREVSPRAA